MLAGLWADRLGRERIAIQALWISGFRALGMGWLLRAPVWIAVLVAVVWRASVVADSAQFSARWGRRRRRSTSSARRSPCRRRSAFC